jgi:hypothetical protein
MTEKKKKSGPKVKPKVTITKENYEKLKRKSTSYTILCQMLECEGREASERIMALIDLEEAIKEVMNRPNAMTAMNMLRSAAKEVDERKKEIDGLLTMFGLEPHKYEHNYDKIEALTTEAQVAANIAAGLVKNSRDDLEGPYTLASLLNRVRIEKKQEQHEYKSTIRKLKTRNLKLKEALKSSMSTNATLGQVMGMFEEGDNEDS